MVVTKVIALARLLWIKYYKILRHWVYGSNEGYSLSLSLMEKVLQILFHWVYGSNEGYNLNSSLIEKSITKFCFIGFRV